MKFEAFRESVNNRLVHKASLEKVEFKDAARDLKEQIYVQLKSNFGHHGIWESKRIGWNKLIDIIFDGAKFQWKGDGAELYKNLKKGTAGVDAATAIYYWLHVYSLREDNGTLNFPFQESAHSLDTHLFGKPQQIYLDNKNNSINRNVSLLGKSGSEKSKSEPSKKKSISDLKRSPLLDRLVAKPVYTVLETGDISLSPLNHASKLHGREEEIATLNKFLLDDVSPFQLLFIIGPSGAGKTRLATEWFKKNVSHCDWQAGFVKEDTKVEDWKSWAENEAINCDTLIIVDYVYRLKNAVSQITRKGLTHINDCNEQANQFDKQTSDIGYPPRLRLIILDHVLDEGATYFNLDDYKKFALGGIQGQVDSHLARMHKNYPPLFLNQSEKMLKEIIKDACGNGIDSKTIDAAYKTLAKFNVDKLDGVESANNFSCHPLFAVLLGKALRNKSIEDITYSHRSDLIGHYFSDKRLPWGSASLNEDLKIIEDGRWVSTGIIAATVLQGVSFESLFETFSNFGIKFDGDHEQKYKAICNYFVSSNDSVVLHKYKPDILGETLFLLFLQKFGRKYSFDESESKFITRVFFKAISAENERGSGFPETNDKFIEFVRRMALNLINDEQSLPTVVNAWSSIYEFLNLNNYPTKKMRLSAAIANLEIAILLRQRYSRSTTGHANKFLSNINLSFLVNVYKIAVSKYDFFNASHKDGLDLILSTTSKYMDLSLELGDLSKRKEILMDLFFIEYEKRCSSGENRYFLCAYYDTPFLFDWIAEKYPLVDINKICFSDRTPLITAIYNQSSSIVEKIVSLKKPNLSIYRDKKSLSFLKLVVRRFLYKLTFRSENDYYAHVNLSAGYYGGTALTWACAYGSAESVRCLLLRTDLNVNFQEKNGQTALMRGCINANEGAVDEIVKSENVEFNLKDKEGNTALTLACEKNNLYIVERLLDQTNIDINLQDDSGMTALMIACRGNEAAIVERLINREDINPSLQEKSGFTALMQACFANNPKAVELLIDSNKVLGLDLKNDRGETPLMVACYRGGTEVIEQLLKSEEKISFEERSDDGKTALYLACEYGSSEQVAVLLESGSKNVVCTPSDSGITPLYSSCLKNDIAKVRTIMKWDKHIDLNLRKKVHAEALRSACFWGRLNIVKCLVEESEVIDLNFQDDERNTALMSACTKGNYEVVHYLLNCKKPINLDLVNTVGSTAFDIANKWRHKKIMELLKTYKNS